MSFKLTGANPYLNKRHLRVLCWNIFRSLERWPKAGRGNWLIFEEMLENGLKMTLKWHRNGLGNERQQPSTVTCMHYLHTKLYISEAGEHGENSHPILGTALNRTVWNAFLPHIFSQNILIPDTVPRFFRNEAFFFPTYLQWLIEEKSEKNTYEMFEHTMFLQDFFHCNVAVCPKKTRLLNLTIGFSSTYMMRYKNLRLWC